MKVNGEALAAKSYNVAPEVVPEEGAGWSRVTHPFATLCAPEGALTVRLACVRHAASVHPEPGSNSPFEKSPSRASVVRLSRSVFVIYPSSESTPSRKRGRWLFLIPVPQYPVFKVPALLAEGCRVKRRGCILRASAALRKGPFRAP